MFGRGNFSTIPFAGLPEVRVFLATSASLVASSDYVIRIASQEFITGAGDSPAHTPFSGTLSRTFRFNRSLINGSRLGGLVQGNGLFTISNADARYDNLTRFYGLDGRRVVQRIGAISRGVAGPYAQFATIFDGTSAGVRVQTSALTVNLRDNSYKLQVPFQPNVYAGTGDLEGGSDLAGKTKPRALGYVQNVTAALVMVSQRIYQVNDGPVRAISAVYDRGVALTSFGDFNTLASLLAASVPGGAYATCLALGVLRLETEPSGTVTADVEGDVTGGTFAASAGQIVLRAVLTAGLKDAKDIYAPAFDQVAAIQAADLGYFAEAGGVDTVADVVDRIMSSVGGWAVFRRNGKFEIGILTPPIGTPAWRFDQSNVFEGSLDRDNLPSDLDPVPWRYRVGWGRNWTVQSDLDGNVTAAHRSFAAEQIRYAEVTSAAVKLDHPLAKEFEAPESFFRLEVDATAEAVRLSALYRLSPSLYSFDGGMVPFALNLGELIKITFPRFDLSRGRTLRIVGFTEDASSGNVKVMGLG